MKEMYKEELRDILEELPCPETIISVQANGKKDLMTATAMWVSYDPVLVAIYIHPSRLTHNLVQQAREFAVNVCSEAQSELAVNVGTVTGKGVDKFKKFKVKTVAPELIKSPLLADCVANYECKVVNSFEVGNHTCFIGLVVAYKTNRKLMPLNRFRGKTYTLGKVVGNVRIAYPH